MRAAGLSIALMLALPTTALASDKPAIAPAPSWVKPAVPPSASVKDDGAPIRILLNDEQVSLQPGKVAVYRELQMKVQTPQGLAIGNISLPWRPDTDELVVHKLRIRRGDKLIDVLDGHSFTVLRRETNLEMAMLDGVLTANIQAEGLQVGDVVELATTLTSGDPVLKGHVEELGAGWNGLPITRAHLRISWPAGVKARFRTSGGLVPAPPITAGGVTTLELSQDDVTPLVTPKGAPLRYQRGRLLELTDFASWADLGALMAPLYAKAAALASGSPIQGEIQRIRSASTDPKARAGAALALVQDRIRYVALAMGEGGLVPADADATWGRRYGDCKAKTALLLALLHGLGIQAEAVVVNAVSGDGLDQRLPMIALFNHVLVRATIAGKSYWLDGTRSGDTNLDRLRVPAFGWGLPLVPTGAAPVRMLPPPLDIPSEDVSIRIDASKGITAPAPFKADITLRGDNALAFDLALSSQTGDARERALRDYWRGRYDFVEVGSTKATFDAAKGEEHLAMEGLATMDWSSGWYETDGTHIGYHADFARDPGPDRDAPFAVDYPSFDRNVETIILPSGFPPQLAQMKAELSETIAGVEYRRHATMVGSTVTIEKTERSLAPEFAAAEAPAAQRRLRELDKSVFLEKPANYRASTADLQQLRSDTPTTASGFVDRAHEFEGNSRYVEAIADYTQAIALDPKNVTALAGRAYSYVSTRQYDKAAADIAAAVAIDPQDAAAFRARGLMAEQQGRLNDAANDYARANTLEPDNSWALARRALVELSLGDRKSAMADASKALEADPKAFLLHWVRAEALFRDGQRDQVRAEAAAILASDPDDPDAQIAAGNIDLMLGDRVAAASLFDRAVALRPDATSYLARARARQADDAGTLTDLEAALKQDPQSAEAWGYKATVHAAKGDFDAALEANSKAIALEPDDPLHHTQRAGVFQQKGESAQARAELAAALKIDPQNRIALSMRATLARENGDSKAAIADLSAAIGTGNDPTLIGERAQAEHAGGDDAAALHDSETALRAVPPWTDMHLLRANIFRVQGRPSEALAEAVALERDNPNDGYAHVVAGKIYGAFHKSPEAMAAFTAALTIKPEAYIYLNRGEIRPRSDTAGRLADFDAALKLDPDLTEALAAKADLLARRGDLAGAAAAYDTLVVKHPSDPFLRLARGIMLARAGDKSRADADLDAAQASPKFGDPMALNTACWDLATANVELERALADCDAALKKLPQNAAILDSRAFVLLRMGRIEDAIVGYGQALALNPKNASSLYGRAVAWARKGDKAKSDVDLAAAISFTPTIAETFADYGVKI